MTSKAFGRMRRREGALKRRREDLKQWSRRYMEEKSRGKKSRDYKRIEYYERKMKRAALDVENLERAIKRKGKPVYE